MLTQIYIEKILIPILKDNPLTQQNLDSNRKKLMSQRWYVEIALDRDVAEQQLRDIKYLMKFLFDLGVPYSGGIRGLTNVDTDGDRWDHVMWSDGTVSPKCDIYGYDDFMLFIFVLTNIKYNDKITSVCNEIQKLTKELEEKIVEIDKAAQNMKNKLEENHKKQIDFLLDPIGSLE